MALSQIYSAVAGHVITAARWNNEFGNIYSNGTDVAFPVTKAVSFAGWTVTYDSAGVSTISSPSNTGFLFTVGSKSGTPSASGSLGSLTASTFTDNNTAASGTAALWTGFSIRTPTLAATNLTVTTTNAATLYIEGPPTAGTNQTITNPWAIYVAAGNVRLASGVTSLLGGDVEISVSDARTDSVDLPLTLTSVTSGAPAAGIGTGILLKAESDDENPSNVGQLEAVFSDVGAGTEDSYFQMLLRVAGAALASCWRFVATGAFNGILTHANTAARTYTFPNRNMTIGAGDVFIGPSSTGAAGDSEADHEGTVQISASQALSGVHFYTNFTLDEGDTLTVADGAGRLCIMATGTITINGIIDAIGAGGRGGTTGTSSVSVGKNGMFGTAAAGGGGGGGTAAIGGDGGSAGFAAGGRGGQVSAAGSAGLDTAGELVGISEPLSIAGGSGGGSGGAGTTGDGGAGGSGGGSVVLCAPTIVLGANSEIKTTGGTGANGTSSGGGGGGGGGAGNFHAFCQSYTDSGCAFTLTAGGAGTGDGTGGDGGAGRAGKRQVLIYA